MQKFSDVSFQNSIIDIDVQKNKVSFDYEKPKTFWNEIPYILILVFPIYIILSGVTMAIVALLISLSQETTITELRSYDMMEGVVKAIIGIILLTISIIVLSIPPVLISLLIYKYREQTSQYYPKLNAWLYSFIGRTHKIKVTDLKTNKYILRYFKNVKLEYELTGEYAKKLKNIKVRPITYDKEEYAIGWFAEFIFTSVPKTGEMNIEFM